MRLYIAIEGTAVYVWRLGVQAMEVKECKEGGSGICGVTNLSTLA